MKLPLAWLKKYIDVSLSVDALADRLTLSGSKVESVEEHSGERVIDVEVTTNRPDCLSILGLAHEVSAITGKKVKRPAVYASKEKPARSVLQVPDILVEDKKGCLRYTARVIRGVKVASSPAEAQKLLGLAGTRAISNVVDATNYVLFECGQPLHAFDLDKLKGNKIIVRRSRKGEKFLGLDGLEYTLDEKTLVIADAERTVAIAGVIGGKLTEVTASTKNILLESAYFDPALVRQAAKKYKISTESSYRFERGVNADNVSQASLRASQLIAEWSGGKDESGLLDKNYSPKTKIKPVTLRLDRAEKFLGLKISQSRAGAVFNSLSFSVKKSGASKLLVTPDGSRKDIRIEADLMEELLRIEGFDKPAETLPAVYPSCEPFRDRKAERLPELKKDIARLGFDEIMTYSLLSEKTLTQSGFQTSYAHAVANAVSAEQAFFRPSLFPGMMQSIQFNAHRKASALRFFEIGNCYDQGMETTRLALALYGMKEENWQRKSENTFFDLKGAVESVLVLLRLDDWEWRGEELFWKGKKLACLQTVTPAILAQWDVPRQVYYCEMTLDEALTFEPGARKVTAVPKYPQVRRDIAFVVASQVAVKDLELTLKEAGAPFLREAVLFDQYLGKNIPAGKRSLAFSLAYQKKDGTFTEDEIQSLQTKLGDTLKNKYQVEFR